MDKLTLSIAFSDNERTRPIAQGRHHPQGVNLIPTVVHPPPKCFGANSNTATLMYRKCRCRP